MQTQADVLGRVWSYPLTNGTRGEEVDPVGEASVSYFDQVGNQYGIDWSRLHARDIAQPTATGALAYSTSYAYDAMNRKRSFRRTLTMAYPRLAA